MKLTTALLLIACLQVAAGGNAQAITLSLRNVPIVQAFTAIEKQSPYSFIYIREDIQKASTVSIEITNGTIESVLELCFRQQPFTYSIVDAKYIVIRRKDAPKTDIVTAVLKPINIRGKITDEKEKAVAGATVQVKGTAVATTTNEQGEFVLDAVEEMAVIIISHVSYQSQEFGLKGRTELTIRLLPRISEMGAVSVNTGYQLLKPNEMTGAVGTVKQEQLDRQVSTDIISKLEGITSGLVFNRNRFGSLSLSIRGRSTILANTDPLIVVDNFVYDGDLNNINPNDVENVTVLKDAAAASIWGVRAGNGVIVITTKRGKYNQPLRVRMNSNVTIGQKPDLSYSPSYLGSSDFIDVETYLFGKGFHTADLNSPARPPVSPVVEILNRRKLGQISAGDSALQIDALRQYDTRGELSRYFYQKSLSQQYAVNLSGGASRTAYYISIGFDKNLSNQVGNEMQRITTSSFLQFIPLKKLEIQTGLIYTQQDNKINNTLTDIRSGVSKNLYPYARFKDEMGNDLPIVKDYRSTYVDTMGARKFLNWRYYPLQELSLADNSSKHYDTRITLGLKYNVIRGLSTELKYQYEKGLVNNINLRSAESYFSRNLVNRFTSVRPGGLLKYNIPVGGILDLKDSDLSSHSGRGQISYTRETAEHSLSGIIGMEVRETILESSSSRAYGYDPSTLSMGQVNYDSVYTIYPNGTGRVVNNQIFAKTTDRFRSIYGNISYAFKQRYIFSMSGRNDKSNLFGVTTNLKSVPLWSTGFKWKLSQEKFYQSGWLSDLSLRMTYGYNGNVNKSLAAFLVGSYSNGFNNYLSVAIQSPGNPELRWEKTRMLNLGFEFELFQKIKGVVDYFLKSGKDLIGDSPLPSSTGFTTAKGNFSDMRGHGLDFQLSSVVRKGDFQWDMSVVLNYAKDKVTRFKSAAGSDIVEGRPVSYLYSIPWAGLDPLTGDPLGILGDTISKAYTALNTLTPAERVYNGPLNPVISGGVQNTLSWNNIKIGLTITYKGGYYFRRSSVSYTTLFNSWQGHTDYLKRWQKPGDEAHTIVPSMIYPVVSSRETFFNNSTALVQKGDHIRLRNISLSYALTSKTWKKTPFEFLNIYLFANNIGILWRANKFNIDPDFQLADYPAPFSFSIGIQAGF